MTGVVILQTPVEFLFVELLLLPTLVRICNSSLLISPSPFVSIIHTQQSTMA